MSIYPTSFNVSNDLCAVLSLHLALFAIVLMLGYDEVSLLSAYIHRTEYTAISTGFISTLSSSTTARVIRKNLRLRKSNIGFSLFNLSTPYSTIVRKNIKVGQIYVNFFSLESKTVDIIIDINVATIDSILYNRRMSINDIKRRDNVNKNAGTSAGSNGKVIAVNNNKGGVLKTSIATNLAGILARNGNDVLIIDTDHQGNSLLTFGRNPDELGVTLYDVLTGNTAPEDAIVTVYTPKAENAPIDRILSRVFPHKYAHGTIDILPSNDDMIGFDFEVIGNPKRYPQPFYLLRDKCAHLSDKYDYLIIDSSPSMSLTIANIFSFPSVEVVIPMQCEQYSRRSLIKTVETIDEFKASHNRSLSVKGIIATLYDARTNLHSDVLQDVRRYGNENGVNVYNEVIPKSVRYASSVAYDSLPITLAEPQHKAAKVYEKLAKEMGLIVE